MLNNKILIDSLSFYFIQLRSKKETEYCQLEVSYLALKLTEFRNWINFQRMNAYQPI